MRDEKIPDSYLLKGNEIQNYVIGSNSNKNKTSFSLLEQESMKIDSVNSLSNNLILNNLSRYNISYDNTSGEMKMLNNSKDISIND
jgi:hypothetical protein